MDEKKVADFIAKESRLIAGDKDFEKKKPDFLIKMMKVS